MTNQLKLLLVKTIANTSDAKCEKCDDTMRQYTRLLTLKMSGDLVFYIYFYRNIRVNYKSVIDIILLDYE